MKRERATWFSVAIYFIFSSLSSAFDGHYKVEINSSGGKEIEKISFAGFRDEHTYSSDYGLFFTVKYRDTFRAEIFGYNFNPEPRSESEYKKILQSLSQNQETFVSATLSNIRFWHDDENNMTKASSSTTIIENLKSYIGTDLEMSFKTEFNGSIAVVEIVIKNI